MKNTIITCRINPSCGTLDFYAERSGESCYIFSRKYRKSLFEYFRKGVSIHRVFDLSRTHGNEIIIHTIISLKGALRYLEKENGIQVFSCKPAGRPSYRRRKEYACDSAA